MKTSENAIRIGILAKEEAYFNTLNRECEASDGLTEVVHIYFRKLPGDLILLESTDTVQYLEPSVNSVIPLKPVCNAMLLYNINNNFRNASRGKFMSHKV